MEKILKYKEKIKCKRCGSSLNPDTWYGKCVCGAVFIKRPVMFGADKIEVYYDRNKGTYEQLVEIKLK